MKTAQELHAEILAVETLRRDTDRKYQEQAQALRAELFDLLSAVSPLDGPTAAAPAPHPDTEPAPPPAELPVLDRAQFPHARAMHDAISLAWAHADGVNQAVLHAHPHDPSFEQVTAWATASRVVATEWQTELDAEVKSFLPKRADYNDPADLRGDIAHREAMALREGSDLPWKREWRYQATAIASGWEAELAVQRTTSEENAPAEPATGAPVATE